MKTLPNIHPGEILREEFLRPIGISAYRLSKETGLTANTLGIGTPGSLDPLSGTLKNSNTVCLNGERLLDDIQHHLGIQVKMANDANCFALAETRMGVVPEVCPEATVVFGVIMGTGVGGGVVINNQVLNGHHGIGGEWGHTLLDESGGPCYCGDTGCTEQVISGPALEKFYREQSGATSSSQLILADQTFHNFDRIAMS